MTKKRSQAAQAPRKANSLDAYAGLRLRERRTILGLSQQDLGNLAGIAEQQVQKYEAGKDRICASRLFLMATALGVTIEWFFEGYQHSARGAASHRPAATLETDEVKLLMSYRGISDKAQRSVVLKIARSFARERK
jgi:transcriptional regulator with XRE-family HTH domain